MEYEENWRNFLQNVIFVNTALEHLTVVVRICYLEKLFAKCHFCEYCTGTLYFNDKTSLYRCMEYEENWRNFLQNVIFVNTALEHLTIVVGICYLEKLFAKCQFCEYCTGTLYFNDKTSFYRCMEYEENWRNFLQNVIFVNTALEHLTVVVAICYLE